MAFNNGDHRLNHATHRAEHAWGRGQLGGVSRREFLYVGALTGLGLTLGDVLRGEARAADAAAPAGPATQPSAAAPTVKEGKAKSVIMIFLPGGIAAQESFDPKLYAPIEYRGPFGSIPTAIPGERFAELWPRTASVADRLTVIRSMTHGEAAHERGVHNMFTGYRPSPAIAYPSIGSVIAHEQGPRHSLPPYMCIPTVPNEHAGSGYLSTAYGPFALGADPADGNFTVRDLAMPGGVDEPRMARRREMLNVVDDHFRKVEKSDALAASDAFYQQAYALISSPQAREAFNLKAEPDALKDAYGRNAPGQRMLLARRLVESGVRYVTLTAGSWDHHDNIADGIRGQAPPVDQAFAALINDLTQRGMLERTLVVLASEFGRTPKVNGTNGRDHYPKVFSIVMAGAGVKRGFVHGKSDSTSADVEDNPVGVGDYAATIYNQIGIDHERKLMSPGNRPIDIVREGKVVKDVLA